MASAPAHATTMRGALLSLLQLLHQYWHAYYYVASRRAERYLPAESRCRAMAMPAAGCRPPRPDRIDAMPCDARRPSTPLETEVLTMNRYSGKFLKSCTSSTTPSEKAVSRDFLRRHVSVRRTFDNLPRDLSKAVILFEPKPKSIVHWSFYGRFRFGSPTKVILFAP